jgi:hypothetical protein
MHNPPDNSSASPPWPPGFSNAPNPSRYDVNIVLSMRFHVNGIPDDLRVFLPPPASTSAAKTPLGHFLGSSLNTGEVDRGPRTADGDG